MDITLPCIFCKHFNKDEAHMTCAAFPNGIPKDIQEKKVLHVTPISGDNGIQYEAVSEHMNYFKYFEGETR